MKKINQYAKYKLFLIFTILLFNVYAGTPGYGNDITVLKFNLLGYEPRTGTVRSELSVLPSEQLIGKNYSLNKDMMFVNYTSISPNSRHKISAGDPFLVTDINYFDDYVVDDSGDEFIYPFDNHHFDLIMECTRKWATMIISQVC